VNVLRRIGRVFWPKGRWRWPLRLLILMVPLSVVTTEMTSQSWFCNSCHIMNSYYASWKVGPHKEVECIRCHIPPGATNFVSAKLNGLGQVVDDVLQRTNSKPSASVSDFSCTRSGCHNVETLKTAGKRPGKGTKYLFDHGKHLGLEYAGLNIHCTTCHSHVQGDQHFQVDTNTCVTCHLAYPKPGGKQAPVDVPEVVQTASLVKTAGLEEAGGGDAKPQAAHSEEKVPPNTCQSCHNVPDKTIQYQGLEVVHAEYVAYGANCQSCHHGATDTPQPVKADQCFSCHDFGKEKMISVKEAHEIHSAGKHKVQCLSCHGITRHGPAVQAMHLNQIECKACHQSQHSVQQVTYKSLDPLAQATNGPTTKPAVTPMFLAHVDCSGCHVQQRALHAKPQSGATVAAATPAACDNCHKPGLGEKMVPMWQKKTHTAYDAIARLLPPADAPAPATPEAAKLVGEARHLLDLVRVDGSWGVHNPRYTQRLLDEAQRKLTEANGGKLPAAPTTQAAATADEKLSAAAGGQP
jgi:nitrate/TMAO reductase-like tetraheme cytochrome c subunit